MLSKKGGGLLSSWYFGTALCKWCDKRGDNHREHLHLYLRPAAQNAKEQQWEKQKARTPYHYHLWIENATNITISQKGLNYFKTSAEHIFKISSASWNWFHKFYPTFTMIENQPPPDKFEKCTWFNFQSGSCMCKPFGHLDNRGKLLFWTWLRHLRAQLTWEWMSALHLAGMIWSFG